MGVEKDIERVLISAEELEAHVAEIGAQISRDFEGKDPIFIGVLKGCFIFMADLMRHVTINCSMDFMAVTSYSGTSYSLFGNYDVAVCAKTGTAEHGSGGSDNASFVLYAPADDPDIAIAIYVEKGAQGGNLGKIAKAILDVYFSEASAVDTVPAENRLN